VYGHPTLKKLPYNSISGQKHVKNKVSKAFKPIKKEFYVLTAIVGQPV
jgi:hypothetical protein